MPSTPQDARSTYDVGAALRPDQLGSPLSGIDPHGSFDHAWCRPCAWRGPGRRARASASADLDRHLLACHRV